MNKLTSKWKPMLYVCVDAAVFLIILRLYFRFPRAGYQLSTLLVHAIGAGSLTGLFIACRCKFWNRHRLPDGMTLWAWHGLLSGCILGTVEWNRTSQTYVVVLVAASGFQLCLGIFAAVRQCSKKKIIVQGYDRLGNSFCWGSVLVIMLLILLTATIGR